jgi:hypothetical protein
MTQQGQINFPHLFCVKTYMDNREGYYLLRWSLGPNENDHPVHILRPRNHDNRLYNIESVPLAQVNLNLNTIHTRKNGGNVVRPIRWAFTNQRLKFEDTRIPVLRILPMNSLPAIKPSSFIPIITPVVPVIVATPLPAPIQKKYTIDSIPQHIVRAILRDAVMQEEVCPITSMEIDIENGAVTSCFHLFEKDAIAKWLSMPGSRDKCPVCNNPCNSYTLNDVGQ